MSHQSDGEAHRPTAEIEDSMTLQLTKRIRVLINTTGLSREECCEVVMSTKNAPTLEEFFFAYKAALILTQSDQPAEQRIEQRYAEDLNLGLLN